MKYTEIQSEYIKKKIQETSWLEHEKIDELICLYKYIRRSPTQFNSGMHFNYLKNQYEKEYFALILEFSETAYLLAIEEKENKKKKHMKLAEIDNKKENQLKQEWIKSGGKP